LRGALIGEQQVTVVNHRPRLILKLGTDGSAYVDFRKVSADQMIEAVRSNKQESGYVVYYREAASAEPSPQAMAVFKRLVDEKPTFLMGDKAPSEWGKLTWFEIEEAPVVSRFFVARGQEMLIYYPKLGVSHIAKRIEDAASDRLLGSVDFLIRSDRIRETPMHEPGRCLQPEAQAKPSLHLRLAYGDQGWASQWALEDIPSNVRSLQQDLEGLALQIAGAMDRAKRAG
jgi:hypothetical protein